LLSGISEMDETLFRYSRKGQRGLGTEARHRGGRSRCKQTTSSRAKVKKPKPLKKVPVLVACDRDQHVMDAVLKNLTNKEISQTLQGHIQPGSTLCTDAHMSHEKLAKQLKVSLKELVTSAGEYVRDEVYHIQTVNAYHSELKRWLNGFFKGVATKYLPRYLGWKRFLKTNIFSEEVFLEQEASHWACQYLM
jgi:transposase-like protein